MQPNKSFWRSIHSLSHPLTIAAVLMLLFNDHWLRHNYPSWLTGKLGDFTWLIFAPLICAALFAWIIPRRLNNHEKIVGMTSFAFIGLWFATAKTIPFIHTITKNTVEAIIGWQGTLRIDPTDLLTLPALLIGYYIWHNADNRSLNLRPVAWIILGLGIMATLATSQIEIDVIYESITCINEEKDSTLIGFVKEYLPPNYPNYYNDDTYRIYASDDGGLSWYRLDDLTVLQDDTENRPECSTRELPLIDPNNPDIQYRYESSEKIERSSDGGVTWVTEYDLFEVRQEVRLYYHQKRVEWTIFSAPYDTEPGPYEAVFHQPTGNVVFAMGWDGMLVRKPDATWEWVGVEQFHLEDLHRSDKIYDFLGGEIVLSTTLFFLILATSAWYMRRPGVKTLLGGMGWLGWLALTWTFTPIYEKGWYIFSFSPAEFQSSPKFGGFLFVAMPLFIFIAIPVTIGTIWDLLRNFLCYIPAIVGVGLITALLFLFPYVLWTQGTIPAYSTARAFALMLTGCSLLAGFTYFKRVLPFIPNPKRPKNSLPGYDDFFHPPDDVEKSDS
jgi:hypothetical protein